MMLPFFSRRTFITGQSEPPPFDSDFLDKLENLHLVYTRLARHRLPGVFASESSMSGFKNFLPIFMADYRQEVCSTTFAASSRATEGLRSPGSLRNFPKSAPGGAAIWS